MGGLDHGIDFYVGLAREARGPVLDIACGTGRILLPCALAGADIDGLDLYEGMLGTLRKKAAALGLAGQGAEASAALGELARRRPGYTPESLRSDLFFCPDATLVARCVEGLGRAIAAEGAPVRLERASGTRP